MSLSNHFTEGKRLPTRVNGKVLVVASDINQDTLKKYIADFKADKILDHEEWVKFEEPTGLGEFKVLSIIEAIGGYNRVVAVVSPEDLKDGNSVHAALRHEKNITIKTK